MFEQKKLTSLKDIGEFKLIDHIAASTKIKHAETIKGIGDDAAVIDSGENYTVITTDMLVEGIHFDLMYTPLKHLGYKSVVVNLSDVYAMNAIPKQITVSLSLSSKYTLEAVEELYAGILLACDKYNIDLIGGDTTSSISGLCISITAIGVVSKNKIVYRNGAKEKDLICVSGDLGAAYLGLQLLEREKEVYKANPNSQPELEGYDYLLERQLKPEARKDVIEMFYAKDITPTAMIDVSDGLSSEILHLCKQSNKGCDIYVEKLPIDFLTDKCAQEFNLEVNTIALNGGEDYELLFTINQKDYSTIKNIKGISVIGHITGENDIPRLITQQNRALEITAQGWQSFTE